MPYIYDIETGARIEVSHETYESYNRRIRQFMTAARMPDSYKGVVLIVGTAGEFDLDKQFQDIFYNPKFYAETSVPPEKRGGRVYFAPEYPMYPEKRVPETVHDLASQPDFMIEGFRRLGVRDVPMGAVLNAQNQERYPIADTTTFISWPDQRWMLQPSISDKDKWQMLPQTPAAQAVFLQHFASVVGDLEHCLDKIKFLNEKWFPNGD